MKKIVMFFLGYLVCHVAWSQWTTGTNINNTNTGNVGIGTTTPGSKLDVRTAGAAAGDQNALNIQNPSSAAYAAVQLSLATGATSNSLIYAQRNALTSGSSLLFWNTDANAVLQPRMVISDAGNVGIGTAAPTERLQIGDQFFLQDGGWKGITRNMTWSTAQSANVRAVTGMSSGMFLTDDGKILFEVCPSNTAGSVLNGSSVVTINNAGYLGMGTDNPQSMIHLVQNQNLAPLVLESNSAGWGSGMYFKNTSASGKIYGIYSSSVGSLNITDANTGADRIFIGANGNVGINTHGVSDSHYQLVVEGGIRSRKLVVDQTIWADYVFDSAYRLPPLANVEKYVREHHHLSEVPPADSVAKNGIDDGINQVTVLKKIEELTLYMIKQDKKIDALAAQVKKIQKTKKK